VNLLLDVNFDSMLTLLVDVFFMPVEDGFGTAFQVDVDGLVLSSTDTLWSHIGDGFSFPVVEEIHPGFGVHRGTVVPTPGGLAVLGLGGFVGLRRRR